MESEILAQPTLLMNLVPVIAQILEACFESTWISLSFRSLGDDYLTDHSTNSGGQVQLKGVRASDMIGWFTHFGGWFTHFARSSGTRA
jgi:hypothetical protein